MADTQSAPRRSVDSAGSRYALEVAFRTMQERCHKLQNRLSQLEEENTRLRLLERKEKSDSIENGVQMRSLRDIITQLEQEKQQLSHHVYMVTSENKHLWNCLSHSKEANKLLGNHLTRISDAFTQHPLNKVAETQINKKAPSILLGQSAYSNTSPLHTASETEAKDSLEEISLKLINSFLQEKSQLEDQYAQMVALHDNDIPLSFTTDNLSQSLVVDIMNGENGSSIVLSDVKEHKSTLLLMKDNLMSQQLQLQAAVENLKKIKPDLKVCHGCQAPLAEFEKNNFVSQETALMNPGLVSASRTKVDSEDSFSESLLNPKQHFAEDRRSGTGQNNAMFHPCEYSRNNPSSGELPQSDTPSLTTSDSNDVDRICPVCSRSFAFSITVEALTQHVLTHFEPEDYVYVEDNPK